MALWYALARGVGSKIPYIFTPITFFVRFITDRYEEEITAVGIWFKARFQAVWNFIRRKPYYVS